MYGSISCTYEQQHLFGHLVYVEVHILDGQIKFSFYFNCEKEKMFTPDDLKIKFLFRALFLCDH